MKLSNTTKSLIGVFTFTFAGIASAGVCQTMQNKADSIFGARKDVCILDIKPPKSIEDLKFKTINLPCGASLTLPGLPKFGLSGGFDLCEIIEAVTDVDIANQKLNFENALKDKAKISGENALFKYGTQGGHDVDMEQVIRDRYNKSTKVPVGQTTYVPDE